MYPHPSFLVTHCYLCLHATPGILILSNMTKSKSPLQLALYNQSHYFTLLCLCGAMRSPHDLESLCLSCAVWSHITLHCCGFMVPCNPTWFGVAATLW